MTWRGVDAATAVAYHHQQTAAMQEEAAIVIGATNDGWQIWRLKARAARELPSYSSAMCSELLKTQQRTPAWQVEVTIVIGAPNRRVADLEIESAIHKGAVFMFNKTFAATEQGAITAEQNNKDMLIDTHYGAIAANVMEQSLGSVCAAKGTGQISEDRLPLMEGSAGSGVGLQPRRQPGRAWSPRVWS